MSAADPVDRASGRLVPLPDVPFLVGELDPSAVLEPFVAEGVLVDNDVNWAALAEREHGCASGVDDFVHVHLGEGLGAAVVGDGRLHGGLAGEIAHVITAGPDGSAMPLPEVFAALGLRREESTAVDVDAVRDALGITDVARPLARAVCGVLSSVVALVNPELVVLGGPWAPAVVPAVAEEFARWPRNAPVASGQVTDPEEAGARSSAAEELRERLIASARSAP